MKKHLTIPRIFAGAAIVVAATATVALALHAGPVAHVTAATTAAASYVAVDSPSAGAASGSPTTPPCGRFDR